METNLFASKELLEVAIDVTVAACRRFGADQAETVISTCTDILRAGHSTEELVTSVFFETGNKVKMTEEDIQFVKDLMAAARELDRGIGALKLLVQREKKNGGVIDVG